MNKDIERLKNEIKALKYLNNELNELLLEAMEKTGIKERLHQGLRKRIELQNAFHLAGKSKGIRRFVKKARERFELDTDKRSNAKGEKK